MRNFFKSKFFICFIAAAIVVSGFGIYSFFGSMSPIKNAVGVVVAPFERIVTAASMGIEKIYGYFYGYEQLEAENARLSKQIAENDTLLRSARRLQEENDRLRELLNLSRKHSDMELCMAEVIASETGNWGKSYTLDCGSKDGIAVGNAVIVDEGMVGYITKVGTTWSDMATVCDTDMKAGAIEVRTMEVGVCEGEFALMRDGYFKLMYLDKNTEVAKGDKVETSGKGGIYPKGLLLGKVLDIKTEEHGITAYAVIEPVVNLQKLHNVFIVKDFEE